MESREMLREAKFLLELHLNLERTGITTARGCCRALKVAHSPITGTLSEKITAHSVLLR